MSNLPLFDDSMDDELTEETWNEDIIDDVQPQSLDALTVYSRDWTVETIASQIKARNIDLNPDFQRGNAWNDKMRSRLIESLIINFPVPEIVLAEKRGHRQSFIVLDGKQRLMTIAGFIFPEEINYWTEPALTSLKVRSDLNTLTYHQMESTPQLRDEYRQLVNSDVRCTVIAGYESEDILYEIFFRLNTSSVPLSLQELRQALYRGPFSSFLAAASEKTPLVEEILGFERADLQARHADLLLRFLAFVLYGRDYRGNLKVFLDDTMKKLNADWSAKQQEVEDIVESFNQSVTRLVRIFGTRRVGRKYVDGKWEPRFNKVLFEVEAYYFRFISDDLITADSKASFIDGFQELCEQKEFRGSIESTTKTPARYQARYGLFKELVNKAFSTSITESPL